MYLSKKDIYYLVLIPVPFQNKVDSLTAQLVSAELDYKRAVELKKRKIGKQRDVDITKAKFDELSATLNDAQYDLDRTEVRAQSDGYVTQMLSISWFICCANATTPCHGICTKRIIFLHWLVPTK